MTEEEKAAAIERVKKAGFSLLIDQPTPPEPRRENAAWSRLRFVPRSASRPVTAADQRNAMKALAAPTKTREKAFFFQIML